MDNVSKSNFFSTIYLFIFNDPIQFYNDKYKYIYVMLKYFIRHKYYPSYTVLLQLFTVYLEL